MKTLKKVSLLFIVAIMIFAMTACNAKIAKADFFTAKTSGGLLNSPIRLDDLKGEVHLKKGNILVLKSNDTSNNVVYNFYNITKSGDMQVFTQTQYQSGNTQYSYELFDVYGKTFISERQQNTNLETDNYYIYDENGKNVIVSIGNQIEFNLDLCFIKKCKHDSKEHYNEYYRVADDGSFELAFSVPAYSAALPEFEYMTENYYYDISSGSYFKIYDKSGNLYYSYKYNGDNGNCFVLSNGNVLVQELTALPSDSANYSYIDELGKKYYLEIKILQTDKKSFKTIANDGIITSVTAKGVGISTHNDMLNDYNGNIENFAQYITIDNVTRRIASQLDYVALSNDGEILSSLSENFGDNINDMLQISDEHFILQTMLSGDLLVDKDGEIIGEVSGIENYNKKYLIASGKIFDHSLNECYDFAKEGYEYYATLSNAFIFSLDTSIGSLVGAKNYYIFDGSMKSLEVSNSDYTTPIIVDSTYDTYFMIKKRLTSEAGTAVMYYLRNGKGEVLGDVSFEISVLMTSSNEKTIIFSGVDSQGVTKFIKMSKG